MAKKAKIKKAVFKPAKIKPMKAPKRYKNAHGKVIAKAEVTGKSNINTLFTGLKKNGFMLAANTMLAIATEASTQIREGIQNQQVPAMGGQAFGKPRKFSNPLHPYTLDKKKARRQDARTLIATGEYVSAIGVVTDVKNKKRYYRVGFTVKDHTSGISMARLWRILEYGAKIKVTDAMRGYLHANGLHLKATTRYIVIPARPHFMPVLLRFRRDVRKVLKWGTVNLVKELKSLR